MRLPILAALSLALLAPALAAPVNVPASADGGFAVLNAAVYGDTAHIKFFAIKRVSYEMNGKVALDLTVKYAPNGDAVLKLLVYRAQVKVFKGEDTVRVRELGRLKATIVKYVNGSLTIVRDDLGIYANTTVVTFGEAVEKAKEYLASKNRLLAKMLELMDLSKNAKIRIVTFSVKEGSVAKVYINAFTTKDNLKTIVAFVKGHFKYYRIVVADKENGRVFKEVQLPNKVKALRERYIVKKHVNEKHHAKCFCEEGH